MKGGKSRICLDKVSYFRFDQFWKLYPRKLGKVAAKKWWLKHDCENDNVLFATILASVKQWKRLWVAENTQAKHIPYASSWLSQQKYQDDVEVPDDGGVLSPQTQSIVSASHAFLARRKKERA